MIAPDTSALVAAFSAWHQHHEVARRIVADGAVLIGHVALETYSVLTRLPRPQRVAPGSVDQLLADAFPDPPLVLPAGEIASLLADLVERRITGGATYDGLIARTAQRASATLATLDRRAVPVYQAVGCPLRILA